MNFSSKWGVFGISFALSVVSLAAHASAPRYKAVMLPLHATNLNDLGQVVGENDNGYAALWSNNQLKTLGTLPGRPISVATAINNAGQVTGVAFKVPTSGYAFTDYRSFIWQNNQMKDIGTLPGGQTAYAEDINDAGQITGASGLSNGSNQAFLWHNNVMTPIGSSGSQSWAHGINNAGQVVGIVSQAGGYYPFLWNGEQMINLANERPSLFRNIAYEISDAGEVIGRSAVDGDTFCLLGENLSFLPAPVDTHSQANDVNSQGQKVGGVVPAVYGAESFAALWQEGALYNLNERLHQPLPGVKFTSALAINEKGQILCSALQNGDIKSYLLSPLTPGDLDGSGCVDDLDLFALTQDFLSAPNQHGFTDLNEDGNVDDFDLFLLTQNFLSGC